MSVMPEGFDVEAAAERLNRRRRARSKAAGERRVRAQELARRVAQELGAALPEIQRIWGFGSTFEEVRPYHLKSDIDLAFEGGAAWRLDKALPRTEFDISLVDLSEQHPDFAAMVRSRGVVLYERS